MSSCNTGSGSKSMMVNAFGDCYKFWDCIFSEQDMLDAKKMFMVCVWEVSQVNQWLSKLFQFVLANCCLLQLALYYQNHSAALGRKMSFPIQSQFFLPLQINTLLLELFPRRSQIFFLGIKIIWHRIPCKLCGITLREAGIYSETCSIWDRLTCLNKGKSSCNARWWQWLSLLEQLFRNESFSHI